MRNETAWQPMTASSWLYWMGVNAGTPLFYAAGGYLLMTQFTEHDAATVPAFLLLLPLSLVYFLTPALLFGRAFRRLVPALDPAAWVVCVVCMAVAVVLFFAIPGMRLGMAWETLITTGIGRQLGSGWVVAEPLWLSWFRVLAPHAVWALLVWSVPAVILGVMSERPKMIPVILASLVLGTLAIKVSDAMFDLLQVAPRSLLTGLDKDGAPVLLTQLTLKCTSYAVGGAVSAAGLFVAFPPGASASPQRRHLVVKAAYLSCVAAVVIWHAGANAVWLPGRLWIALAVLV
ncbi:MAG: hypothetical protein AAF441_24410 [Pseudomonadota bacterium]